MNSRLSISRLLLQTGIFFPFFCSLALAAEPAKTEPIELTAIQVVTASRTGEDANHAMASVSVISATDIQRSVAQDLLELLRLEAHVRASQ